MSVEEGDGNILCGCCNMWLNGSKQWEDHRISKKHRRNFQKGNHITEASKSLDSSQCTTTLVKLEGNAEHIQRFCDRLTQLTMGSFCITRRLLVTSDFSDALLSQWGLQRFPLPWLIVEQGCVVYDCRNVMDAMIPFIFGRVGRKCGFIPKTCFADMESNGDTGTAESILTAFPMSPAGFSLSCGSSTLARTHVEDVECAICQCTFEAPLGLLRALACDHHACLDCKQKWIMSQVEANILPVRCFGCLPSSGRPESSECNTWPEFYVRASLCEKEYADYLAASLRIWSLCSSDARVCNTPDCQGLTFVQPGDVSWTCSFCRSLWCVQCRKKHDPSVSCASFAQEEKADHEMRKLIASGSVKQCPVCKNGVQKNEGCNHMTCISCRAHFCYVCGQQLDAAHPYSHFRRGTCPLFDVPSEIF